MSHPFLATRRPNTAAGADQTAASDSRQSTARGATPFTSAVLAAMKASDEALLGVVEGDQLHGAVLRIIRDPSACSPMIVFALAHLNDVTILIAKHFLARDLMHVPSLRGCRELTVFRDQLMRIDEEGEQSRWTRGRVTLSNSSSATSNNMRTRTLRAQLTSGSRVEVANLGWVTVAPAGAHD